MSTRKIIKPHCIEFQIPNHYTNAAYHCEHLKPASSSSKI